MNVRTVDAHIMGEVRISSGSTGRRSEVLTYFVCSVLPRPRPRRQGVPRVRHSEAALTMLRRLHLHEIVRTTPSTMRACASTSNTPPTSPSTPRYPRQHPLLRRPARRRRGELPLSKRGEALVRRWECGQWRSVAHRYRIFRRASWADPLGGNGYSVCFRNTVTSTNYWE